MATRYEEGDVVATPDGHGVVAAVLTERFYFPQEGGEDEYERVSATSDQPAYVVGLESVGSAPYRASALEATSLENEEEDVEASEESPVYVVARETRGFDVFWASELREGGIPDHDADLDEATVVDVTESYADIESGIDSESYTEGAVFRAMEKDIGWDTLQVGVSQTSLRESFSSICGRAWGPRSAVVCAT